MILNMINESRKLEANIYVFMREKYFTTHKSYPEQERQCSWSKTKKNSTQMKLL